MTDERAALKRLRRQAREEPGDVPLDRIVSALDHPEGPVRELAATALYAVSKDEPGRVLDELENVEPLLSSDRPGLRHKAAETMTNVGNARPAALVPYVPVFVAALDDESASVTRNAAEALRIAADADPGAVAVAAPGLLSVLESESDQTRVYALEALWEVVAHDPDAVEGIVEPLLDVLEDRYERTTGVTYDPNAVPTGADPSDQMRGYRSLINDPEARAGDLNVRTREAAAAVFATFVAADPDRAADALAPHVTRVTDLLDDRSPVVRETLVESLRHVAEVAPAAVREVEDELEL